MYQQQVRHMIFFLMLIDAIIVFGAVYAASYIVWAVYSYDWRLDDLDAEYIALFLVFANNFIMGKVGLYSDRRSSKFRVTVRDIIISVVILFAIFSGLLFSLKISISRFFILLCATIITISFIIERLIIFAHNKRRQSSGYNCHRVLLVGSPDRILAINEALNVQSSWGHKVIGYISESQTSIENKDLSVNMGSIDDLQSVLTSNSVDEVIFSLSHDCANVDLKKCISLCEEVGTTYRIVPSLYDPDNRYNIQAETIQGIPTLVKSTTRINYTGMFYKRILDTVGGLFGSIIFLILYPIIGLLIKLDSHGPVLFCQPRVGEHGRVFYIYKFRTMQTGADKMLNQLMAKNEMKGHMFKISGDPRITRVGRFLRKTSLDEFPQFINVIRGEMSLVGTRPPTVEEVACYEARQRRRISIKPGITGLWQISGRNKIEDFEQVLKLDLQYIDNWRFLDDLNILWKTIWVVLARKGAK